MPAKTQRSNVCQLKVSPNLTWDTVSPQESDSWKLEGFHPQLCFSSDTRDFSLQTSCVCYNSLRRSCSTNCKGMPRLYNAAGDVSELGRSLPWDVLIFLRNRDTASKSIARPLSLSYRMSRCPSCPGRKTRSCRCTYQLGSTTSGIPRSSTLKTLAPWVS